MALPFLVGGSGFEKFYRYIGVPFFILGFVACLVVAVWYKIKGSGKLLIDRAHRQLQRQRGLSFLPWSTIDLPEHSLVVLDSYGVYTKLSPTRDLQLEVTPTVHYRVMVIPLTATNGSESGETRRMQDELYAFWKDEVDKRWETERPPSPEGAIVLFDEPSYSFGRVLAETITRIFDRQLLDLTLSPPNLSGRDMLEQSIVERVKSQSQSPPDPGEPSSGLSLGALADC